MRYLRYHTYCSGRSGLSNGIMSMEIGVVLSALMNRVLVLEGNIAPTANVVDYGGRVSNRHPSRITDLFDMPVPWTDASKCDIGHLDSVEFSPTALMDAVFYAPSTLDTNTDDFRAFARGRTCLLTNSRTLDASPVVSLSGGREKLFNLTFYSYFLYLDPDTRRRAEAVLRAMRPIEPLAQYARSIARSLGTFNAVHVRRGDFKLTYGVTTLDRGPEDALETLDQNFSRDDTLLILTDERQDPFFDEIRRCYPRSLFIDDVILDEHGAEFAELPCRDSMAIALLSQLVAAESQDFIGTMTSTFTALIQRNRGNLGRGWDFKFLWNELPDEGVSLERGRHAISTCVPMERGRMVEEFSGPYSWNRFNQRINPAWMREWPEASLSSQAASREPVLIAFADHQVSVTAPDNVRGLIEARFAPMLAREPRNVAWNVVAEQEGPTYWVTEDEGVRTAASSPSDMMAVLSRAVVRAFIRARPDLVWLHAAALHVEGSALILVGAWGRGKSSMSASLIRRGWTYLSDDIVAIDPDTMAIYPFAKTLRVRQNPGRPLDAERVAQLRKDDVQLQPTDIADGPAVCRGVIFPRFGHESPNQLEPCQTSVAVLQLLEGCLSFSHHTERALRFSSELAQAVPVFHLSFHDSQAAAELLVETFAFSGAKA